jgi:DNA-binding transcriptional ArsR family regulator
MTIERPTGANRHPSLTTISLDAKYGAALKRDPEAHTDAYEAVFTALAHPVRRRILLTINFQGGSMTAGEIAAMFEHAWPTTTRHLQVLESAGLLQHERQGRSRIYRIARPRLALVRAWLAWFAKDPNTGKKRRTQ